MAGTKQPAEAMGFVYFFFLPFLSLCDPLPLGSLWGGGRRDGITNSTIPLGMVEEKEKRIERIGRGAFCIG